MDNLNPQCGMIFEKGEIMQEEFGWRTTKILFVGVVLGFVALFGSLSFVPDERTLMEWGYSPSVRYEWLGCIALAPIILAAIASKLWPE